MCLKSGHVILRRLRKNDSISLVKFANNIKISRNLRDGFPHPYTVEDADNFIQKCENQNTVTTFAIEFEGEYVGNISLVPGKDVYRKSAEIGYFIGEPYWNKGIATIAVNLITDYGFNKLGLIRIHTGLFEYNIASQRVLEKCGFYKEAILQKSILKNNKIWNEVRYAKINPEENDLFE